MFFILLKIFQEGMWEIEELLVYQIGYSNTDRALLNYLNLTLNVFASDQILELYAILLIIYQHYYNSN